MDAPASVEEVELDRLTEIEALAKAARLRPSPSGKDLLCVLEQIESICNPAPPAPFRSRFLHLPDGGMEDLKQETPTHYTREDGTKLPLKGSQSRRGQKGHWRPKAPKIPRSPTVIGLGTGRCGTKSLARLLNLPHESKPGILIDDHHFKELWETVKAHGGDVGFYWMAWIEAALKRDPEVRFVCIEREKERCVMSLMWNFQMTQTRAEEYWTWYRWKARAMEVQHPKNFRVFQMPKCLNAPGDLLRFARGEQT